MRIEAQRRIKAVFSLSGGGRRELEECAAEIDRVLAEGREFIDVRKRR